MQELIDQYAESPHLAFRAIFMVDHALWAHVDWTSYADIFKQIPRSDSKPKISNFGFSIPREEYVSRF
jgi:hypothetical protein